MNILNATEVRRDWSTVVDNVIRVKPQIIKRTRDYMILSDVRFVEELLEAYKYHADVFEEEDGSVTLSLADMDLCENAPDIEQAKTKLAESILEYAEEYYSDFVYWNNAPNRKGHLPYVFKALLADDIRKIEELIECRNGKN